MGWEGEIRVRNHWNWRRLHWRSRFLGLGILCAVFGIFWVWVRNCFSFFGVFCFWPIFPDPYFSSFPRNLLISTCVSSSIRYAYVFSFCHGFDFCFYPFSSYAPSLLVLTYHAWEVTLYYWLIVWPHYWTYGCWFCIFSRSIHLTSFFAILNLLVFTKEGFRAE